MSQLNSNQVPAKNRKNKWYIDVHPRKSAGQGETASPPGYAAGSHSGEKGSSGGGTDQKLIDKRGWDIALAPIKSLPMNIFLMYMAGNTISIFPIMMVGMMFFRPIQAMMGIKNTMKMLQNSNKYLLLTLVFIIGNVIALALATYKCHSMGLLPTHESDWLAFVSPLERQEYLAGGVSL